MSEPAYIYPPGWRRVGGNAEEMEGTQDICDIYDFFAPHINVLTYLLTRTVGTSLYVGVIIL